MMWFRFDFSPFFRKQLFDQSKSSMDYVHLWLKMELDVLSGPEQRCHVEV